MARRARFGYNSTRWIRQDWRFVKEKRRGSDGIRKFDTSIRCGGKTKDGRVRLCLPDKVITALTRTAEGRDALAEQARRKLKNGRGVRTPYNAIVLGTATDEGRVHNDLAQIGRTHSQGLNNCSEVQLATMPRAAI
jgi:hypothetical protein